MSDRLFHCYTSLMDRSRFITRCRAVAVRHGFRETGDPARAHFAIAPLLTRKLSDDELAASRLGVLIFHPSALPYRRGMDAIKWALDAGEPVSGVTWFWGGRGLDTGPICAQEPVVLKAGETPREAYERRFIPAGLTALDQAISEISRGRVRRVHQDESLATYDQRFPTRKES